MADKDIKELDCSKMKIHPSSPQLVNWMNKNIPLIQGVKIKEKKGFTRAIVYRYVVLMYDPMSPLQNMFGLDWFGRKYEACEYAGFDLRKGRDGYYRFTEEVDNLVLGKESSINDTIIHYLAWVNSYKWKQLVYLHESHMRFVRGGLDGTSVDVKSTKEARQIWMDIEELSNSIGRLTDETDEFRSRFYYQIEASRLAIRPEDYSKALGDGDQLRGDSPHGAGYTIGKLRFAGDKIPE